MGSCTSNPQHVYIVEENGKILCCTYNKKLAESFIDCSGNIPLPKNREVLQYNPDNNNSNEIVHCIKHTYPYL